MRSHSTPPSGVKMAFCPMVLKPWLQADATITNPYYGVGDPSSNGASWEYKIMLANETGRDVMFSLPPENWLRCR